jgi:solute carrier family 35 protein E2
MDDDDRGEKSKYEMTSLLRNDNHKMSNVTNLKQRSSSPSARSTTPTVVTSVTVDRSNSKRNDDDDKDTRRSQTLFLKTAFWIAAWYMTSLATLFLNKIILSRRNSSVHVLGMCQMTTAAVLGGWSAFGCTGLLLNAIYRRCGCGGRGVGGHRHPQRGIGASETQLVMTLKRKQSDTTIVAMSASSMRDVDGVDEENNSMCNTQSPSSSNYASNNDKASDSATPSKSITKSAHFKRDMTIVGIFRGLTVVLGLIALEHVPVSFVETIKASAPAFTVVFARLILQERTAPPVVMSLIPVIAGLVLCSASELRFDAVGFIAAVMNNCADCVQNVISKRMLNHMSPTTLQFYTSAAALTLQAPFLIRDVAGLALGLWSSHHYDSNTTVEEVQVGESSYSDLLEDLDRHLSEDDHFANLASTASWHRELSLSHLLVLDAVFYHLQSVSAYSVMGCMSPVSQSVANTLKRALLVWASILYFGNPVTNSGIAGMGMVVLGVFLYNHTRQSHN